RVTCALLETAEDEARWVAERVLELVKLPPSMAPDGGFWPGADRIRGRAPTIAVLCRKRAQFPAMRAAIEARGVGVEVVGLGGLLIVPEVADIVATLRVLHDPGASGTRRRTRPRGTRVSARSPPSCGRCAGTPAARCRTWWARWSGSSGWTSRWRRSPGASPPPPGPIWTRSPTLRRHSPTTRRSRR